MKLLTMLQTMAVSAALLSAQAQAAIVTITPATTPQWTSSSTANLDAAAVSLIVGRTVSELYKMNVGDPTDSGSAAGWYSTTFANTASDPQEATITWGGGSYIVCPYCFLLVKDGNNQPAQYIFDIGSWDGKDTLQLNGFWTGNGAISHVAILGDPQRTVPAPATLALLGLGVLGLGLARRRSKK